MKIVTQENIKSSAIFENCKENIKQTWGKLGENKKAYKTWVLLKISIKKKDLSNFKNFTEEQNFFT